MKDKEKRELIVIATAMIAFAFDVMSLALQVQTIPFQFLRLYYIPVFAKCLYDNAKADVECKKAAIRQKIEERKAEHQERFLEDYAKFVSEVHK